MKIQYTEQQIEQILTLYNGGMSVKNVAITTGFGRKAIFNLIKKLVPDKRTLANGEGQRARHGTQMNSEAFDILTPEALYWIGYLYADGGIEAKRPIVALGSIDKEHLDKYSQFFGGNLKVHTYKNSNRSLRGCTEEDGIIYRVAFGNKKIHNRLIELGFTSNKSSYILPHPLLINSRDFWRGVVDGDGWIGNYKRSDCNKRIETIGLSGTELTLIEFINFINNSGIVCGTTPLKKKGGNVWGVDIHSTIAKKVMTLLYKDSSVYLDRKYRIYQEIIEMENEPVGNLDNR